MRKKDYSQFVSLSISVDGDAVHGLRYYGRYKASEGMIREVYFGYVEFMCVGCLLRISFRQLDIIVFGP